MFEKKVVSAAHAAARISIGDVAQAIALGAIVLSFAGYVSSLVILYDTGLQPIEVYGIIDYFALGVGVESVLFIVLTFFNFYIMNIYASRASIIRLPLWMVFLTTIPLVLLSLFIAGLVFSIPGIYVNGISFRIFYRELMFNLIDNIPIFPSVLCICISISFWIIVIRNKLKISQPLVFVMILFCALCASITTGLAHRKIASMRYRSFIATYEFSDKTYNTLRYYRVAASSTVIVFRDRLTGDVEMRPISSLVRKSLIRRLNAF